MEHASRSYLERLVTEIDGSARIDLVEHSWYHMSKSEDGESGLIQEPIEFRRISLSQQQRRELSEIIRHTNPAPKYSGCPGSLEVHHTVEFWREGKIHSRIDLCFGTLQVDRYLGHDMTSPPVNEPYPEELLQRMRKWIVSLGMDPAADWQRLAEQAGDGA